MTTSITRLAETVRVSGVEDVHLTDPVPDGAGGYIRSIQIIGPGNVPILSVQVQGATEDAIAITTPNLTF